MEAVTLNCAIVDLVYLIVIDGKYVGLLYIIEPASGGNRSKLNKMWRQFVRFYVFW
jgi:hypothetical protein